MDPTYVARELAYGLNKVGCKGIVIDGTDSALNTLKLAVPDLEKESRNSVPTLKYIIVTGLDQNPLAAIRDTHLYNELIMQNKQHLTEHEICPVDPELLLSIFWTSGSTGQPKAVTFTNFGVFNIIAMFVFYYGSYISRHCAPLTMHHMSSGLLGCLLPSMNPCKIIIPALTFDPEATMRAIHEEKCTCMLPGAALLHFILAHPNRYKYDLSSLQYVGVGGKSIQPDFLRMLKTELCIDRIGQEYGLTESGNFLTSTLYIDHDDDRRYTSIGRCLPHIELKIVSNDGTTLPIGSEGEIWVRGYSITCGYYNDPEQTAEAITNSGWFRTGDIGRMDEEGYLFFVGRKKEIIIQGGLNTYPLEIEQVIYEHPSVAEVYVFGVPDPLMGEVIGAFVALKSGMTCEAEELKLFLSDKLHAYIMPKYIRFVDDFPRTPLGKVPRYKLVEDMVRALNN
ncbi:unnamed protein product [Rotaria sp. Silwood1]|nr:unnamed protein product [Rotaria sp. Silwood1]